MLRERMQEYYTAGGSAKDFFKYLDGLDEAPECPQCKTAAWSRFFDIDAVRFICLECHGVFPVHADLNFPERKIMDQVRWFVQSPGACPACYSLDINWNDPHTLKGTCAECHATAGLGQAKRAFMLLTHNATIDPELAARIIATHRRQEEQWNTLELRKLAARRRALNLLLNHLNGRQRRLYNEKGYFYVKQPQSGRRYKITFGSTHNVYLVNDRGSHLRGYCIHPNEKVPVDDVLLAQKLLLECNEEHFLKIANETIIPQRLRRRHLRPNRFAAVLAEGL